MVAVMQHAYLAHGAYISGREGRRMMKKFHLEKCCSINMIELYQLYCQTFKTHIKPKSSPKIRKRVPWEENIIALQLKRKLRIFSSYCS